MILSSITPRKQGGKLIHFPESNSLPAKAWNVIIHFFPERDQRRGKVWPIPVSYFRVCRIKPPPAWWESPAEWCLLYHFGGVVVLWGLGRGLHVENNLANWELYFGTTWCLPSISYCLVTFDLITVLLFRENWWLGLRDLRWCMPVREVTQSMLEFSRLLFLAPVKSAPS